MVNDYIYYVKDILQAKIISSNDYETIYLVNIVHNIPSSLIVNLEIIYSSNIYTVRYVMYVDTKTYECVLGKWLDLVRVKEVVSNYRLMYSLRCNDYS